MRCDACGRELDERVETVWNKIEGWEKKRDQGGTNHVALRRVLPEFRCNGCMTLAQSGLSFGQESIEGV